MTLLERDPTRIAPDPPVALPDDRAGAEIAAGTPEPLRSDLIALLGEDRLLGRASDLIRYASDASPYRRIPRAVVAARDINDVIKLFAYARSADTSLTFRSGGTSLNGQAQTDAILVDVRRHFGGIQVLDSGRRARVMPGTVLGHANRVLGAHGRKLGPDPASTEAATIGGVVANNSGGMRCGTWHDSYSTVTGMTFALPSGTIIDTTAPDAGERFRAAEPALAAGMIEIRDEIRSDDALRTRIAKKFEIKNTTGYRLCAFLDADEPLEIFRRLIIGSEGTLAFLAEVEFETIALGRYTTTALLHFAGLDGAAEAVPGLVETGSTATELMVAPTLIAAAWNLKRMPEAWKELPADSAAVLVEFRADEEGGLDRFEDKALKMLEGRKLLQPATFTRERELTASYWRAREGMFGLVGGLRPAGTALITEDVCVPPARVAEAAKQIQDLLSKYGFLRGVAGHASAGNLHFTLTPDFAKPEDLERYEGFMGEVVDLIVDTYDGSLKAEHGTGVNMAPYVEREWGERATELMWRVKELADPDNVLSPGVVLNRDPECHLRNLMTTPEIEEVATSCVECGMCEPACPSRELTLTPRQRIVLRREMARQPAGSPLLEALLTEYEYDGLQTCATDGSCMHACPLGIDTGKLVKGLRADQATGRAERTALRLAKRWGAVEAATRAGLRAGDGPGQRLMRSATAAARGLLDHELVPSWPKEMPHPAAAKLPTTVRAGATAVFFPACINRIFGRSRGGSIDLTVTEALVAVSARAGLPIWIPDDIAGHCCSTPWTSKGYASGAEWMANSTIEALWRWTDEGALPVICDAASCSLGLIEDLPDLLGEANSQRHAELEIVDAISWTHDRLLAELEPSPVDSATVHPPCSAAHLELTAKLEAVTRACAREVSIPLAAGCCGFAGDRGFLHPELTAAATAAEAAELAGQSFEAHVCSNRTCEIGMERATGVSYESVVQLLERTTRSV